MPLAVVHGVWGVTLVGCLGIVMSDKVRGEMGLQLQPTII